MRGIKARNAPPRSAHPRSGTARLVPANGNGSNRPNPARSIPKELNSHPSLSEFSIPYLRSLT